MERKVAIYIEGERIELFNDEKIGVNSSIQNIQDVSKVFTDFSQSFSVPCSQHNNPIFEHFYENALNGTINQNLRRNAWIEIDATFFRSGKIQLESVQLKNNQPYAYKITFYGDIRKLKDRFGEDKLKDLDYSPYTHDYSGAEILDRIESSTDYDVRYPLISSRRVWQWAEPTTPLDNINTVTGAIKYQELFPALKNKRIFETIEAHYGITFQGIFLDNPRFTNSFLHFKNKPEVKQATDTLNVDFTSKGEVAPNIINFADRFDLTTDTLHVEYIDYLITDGTISPDHFVTISTLYTSSSATYHIEVYQNGSLVNTISPAGTGTWSIGTFFNVSGLDIYYTFKVYADSSMDLDMQIQYKIFHYIDDGAGGYMATQDELWADTSTITLSSTLNLSDNAPDMKVVDYFSGILKEFNLTCYPLSEDVFQIEPLEDWYSKGRIIDITPYVDIDSIDIKRVPLYKRIEFSHDKSESFMNRKFMEFFGREYGDLVNLYPYDGSDYVVKVPFEQPLFNKFENIDLQVGYYLKPAPNYEPYIPKPVILYFNGISPDGFRFDTGTGIVLTTGNAVFGQDTTYNSVQWSLNFGQEISSYYLTTINNALYDVYYKTYLENLFNLKNRLTDLKCKLPLRILTSLKLNDRVVIRDKRYIINEMKTELTSGDVNFTLLHDFRPTKKKKPFKPVAGTVDHVMLLGNKVVQADIDTSSSMIIASETTIYEDTLVTFTMPTNPTPLFDVVTEDGLINILTEQGDATMVMEPYAIMYESVFITYTSENGDQDIEELIFVI